MAQLERTTGDPTFAARGSGRITSLTAAPGLCLVLLGSNGVESERYLTRVTRTLIGRSADCDLVLHGETVSRVHAVIRRESNGFLIEDRSRNGTWVNGIRVRERLLRDGDQLRIGP
ncbi:MAG: FHA domain-containing protein, partial [Acidobacteriota bacterium]